MVIYGLKTCDSCRKAKSALLGMGKEVQLHDLRDDPLSRDELARFLAALGPDLVNRRSTTWRGLDEAARAGDPLDLLEAHPTLMKRPVIEAGGQLYLGWNARTEAALNG
ncbi:arsenate reductase family protein [Rhodovulum sp. YEN HP10]|uniref:arsenate reductase family protein n=1 Tax=Rhodovulum sp. HP10 TaxID=3387397 RepID=UPI0039E04C50